MLIPLLALFLPVAAHRESQNPNELKIQRALQAAAYHCAPEVAEFTASRRSSLAQKVLSGVSALPAYQDFFALGSALDDHTPDSTLLTCSPVRDTYIQNNTCVLAPEVTEGPYYHIAGHPIRQNIAEWQDGLLLLLDIGVIDVESCKPLPNVLVDLWHSNATGYYGGHPEPAFIYEEPEGGAFPADFFSPIPPTDPTETFLRGAWPTDRNGVSQFTTIFPGYYPHRATHIHVKVFMSWEPLPNGTYIPGKLAHVGQFFFDDKINMHIDNMHPYTKNPIRHTLGRTRNWDDLANIFEDAHGPNHEYDPVFGLELLGSVISQGLMGYITLGLNASASYDSFIEVLHEDL